MSFGSLFVGLLTLPGLLTAATLNLRAGDTVLDAPLKIKSNTAVRGNPRGSRLLLKPGFSGSAAIVVEGVANVTLAGFEIVGDRADMQSEWYLPTGEAAFADFYPANGILIRKSTGVTVRDVRISRVRTFPILVNASGKVLVDQVREARRLPARLQHEQAVGHERRHGAAHAEHAAKRRQQQEALARLTDHVV